MKFIPYGSVNKRSGDRAELRFMEKALEHGFEILKPWGDNSAFDLALVAPSGVLRVQVRSSSTQLFGRYRIPVVYGERKMAYKKGLIDFIAAYVFPYDAWYIVPAGVLHRQNNIYLRPHNSTYPSPWEKFRDAWHLLA